MLPITKEAVDAATIDDSPGALNTAVGSLIYVRPLYVIATGTEQPTLEFVIVSHADNVVMCDSLTDSIRALFGVTVRGLDRPTNDSCAGDVVYESLSSGPSDSGGGFTIGDGPPLEEALKLLDEAETALRSGNLGRYQELVDGARGILEGEVGEQGADASTDAAVDGDAETDE